MEGRDKGGGGDTQVPGLMGRVVTFLRLGSRDDEFCMGQCEFGGGGLRDSRE